MKKTRIIEYKDELNDDFAGTKLVQSPVDNDYNYLPKTKLSKFLMNVVYYVIALPLVTIFSKIQAGVVIKNRKNLKELKGKNYIIYMNHTSIFDCFIGPMISAPKKNYIIANPDAVSIKGIRWLLKAVGCLPLPTTISGMPNFLKTTTKVLNDKRKTLIIYPEAHIWPYYTKIRPYKENCFKYACINNMPIITATTIYKKRKVFGLFPTKKPKRIIMLGKVIYPDNNKALNERIIELRNRAYNEMVENAKLNEVEYIKYVKKN